MKISDLTEWNIQDHLDSDEAIAEYLTAALEENDPDFFLTAIGDVVKAMGARDIANRMGHGVKSLYKSISPGAKPRYDTVLKMIDAMGFHVEVRPNDSRPSM